jgi:ferric-dicitrate binding protein FerR (iron transport regulator)
MTSFQPSPPSDDDSLDRLLEDGLRRSPLTDAAYGRIRAAVASEWHQTARPRARRVSRWSTIAAGLAAAIVTAVVLLHLFGKPAVVGVVARAEGGGLSNVTGSAFVTGSALHVGDVLLARGPVLVSLVHGGTLRMMGGTRLEAIAADQMALVRGEIYVDLPRALPRASTFSVRTPLGLVEHLGTQFDVSLGQALRIRVREGSIRLLRSSGAETVMAGTELTVPTSTGPATKRSIATHGPDWSWVEALEPVYVIDDHRLIEFLQWTARETGRRLSFEDDHAREVAEQTRLHGSITGMRPTEALDTVLATTSLRYDLEGGLIRVSSGG